MDYVHKHNWSTLALIRRVGSNFISLNCNTILSLSSREEEMKTQQLLLSVLFYS